MKKALSLILLLGIFALVVFLLLRIKGDENQVYNDDICLTFIDSAEHGIDEIGLSNLDAEQRIYFYKSAVWNKKEVLIYFISSDEDIIAKALASAKNWEEGTGLKISRTMDRDNSDIRVEFTTSGGGWSYIGRVGKSRAVTMSLGIVANRDNLREIDRVTIHEFGHAFGAGHEHQHCQHNIQWDEANVRADLKRQGWDDNTIYRNMFAKVPCEQTNFSAYDRKSIMHYGFPARWTKNRVASPWNYTMSALDKEWAALMYPPDVVEPPKPNPIRVDTCFDVTVKITKDTVFSVTSKITRDSTFCKDTVIWR